MATNLVLKATNLALLTTNLIYLATKLVRLDYQSGCFDYQSGFFYDQPAATYIVRFLLAWLLMITCHTLFGDKNDVPSSSSAGAFNLLLLATAKKYLLVT